MKGYSGFWIAMFAFIFLSGMNGDRVRPPEGALAGQAGRVVLYFNGSTIAMSQVDYAVGFTQPPVIVCSASNEDAAGTAVGCQSLSVLIGAVSAEVDEPRDKPMVVNWVAVGE